MADRNRVLSKLNDKITALLNSRNELTRRIARETNAAMKNRLDLNRAAVRAELVRCRRRYSAIANNKPFGDPGQVAEQELLASIQAADASIAGSAAATALMAAFSRLVAAYPASSTNA